MSPSYLSDFGQDLSAISPQFFYLGLPSFHLKYELTNDNFKSCDSLRSHFFKQVTLGSFFNQTDLSGSQFLVPCLNMNEF